MSYYEWRPYVPVADRRRKAEKKLAKLKMKGQTIDPVRIEGRTIPSRSGAGRGVPTSNVTAISRAAFRAAGRMCAMVPFSICRSPKAR